MQSGNGYPVKGFSSFGAITSGYKGFGSAQLKPRSFHDRVENLGQSVSWNEIREYTYTYYICTHICVSWVIPAKSLSSLTGSLLQHTGWKEVIDCPHLLHQHIFLTRSEHSERPFRKLQKTLGGAAYEKNLHR